MWEGGGGPRIHDLLSWAQRHPCVLRAHAHFGIAELPDISRCAGEAREIFLMWLSVLRVPLVHVGGYVD